MNEKCGAFRCRNNYQRECRPPITDLNFLSTVIVEVDSVKSTNTHLLVWGVDLDARTWGIKALSPRIPSQIVQFLGECDDDDDENSQALSSQVESIQIDSVEIEYESGSDERNVGLFPFKIEIDRKSKKAVVYFQKNEA